VEGELRYFAVGAWFPTPIDKTQFGRIYTFLLEKGYDVVYEPETNPRGVTLRLERGTISIQNKRCAVWHKRVEDGPKLKSQVEEIIAEFLRSSDNTTGKSSAS